MTTTEDHMERIRDEAEVDGIPFISDQPNQTTTPTTEVHE